ncbi:hypothetical protein TCAL_06117 [Tigriopus californicus]|uniref:Matrin-type domain-containing protein n=1 Tax=Tigriopus californicus TaxID=6832 RepID=A0A553NYS1_TIGCA|nr:splicing factor 3A subunit 3-like [Tigriopus californicus]TRY70565.1 hypothetical protein TCAL_06117 [Tigriopus californicus]|eukprot:TCALIF_06117-PA protein Name:"Similar to noi Splicing factor 3A subunit 3 (Drosophila melanogaster)" AED:0.04 eAED:0.05 QI:0/-1/0/1/-1/1/1/0/564
MESLLEQQRRYHEERERLLDAMVGETLILQAGKVTPAPTATVAAHSALAQGLSAAGLGGASGGNANHTALGGGGGPSGHPQNARPLTHRETLNGEHRIRLMLDRQLECTRRLKEIYEDKDGQRKDEVAALSGPHEFQEFYARFKQIKEFHRSHPGQISVPMSVEFEELKRTREHALEDPSTNGWIEFSDEEGYGKFLDLHQVYELFVNLKGVERVDYMTYVMQFDRLFDIPKERKGAHYKAYLHALLDYCHDYVRRAKPLLDVPREMASVRQEFEVKFAQGDFPGWSPEQPAGGGALATSSAHLDLSAFSTWQELCPLGLNRLKSGLMALGLKCGGTLEERAQRLFATKGQTLDAIDPKLKVKTQPKGQAAERAKALSKQREIAALEAQVYRFAELLSEQRAATQENVERKQARTDLERDESDEELSEEELEEDNDEDVIYNPKKLPLGWDGKPIPYWLYKLHGLNITYNCEICGNYPYKGPKAFQRHFAEWRHAHGMRCLGIPNTAHFANVTQIEDAMSLWEKLKSQKQDEAWKPEHEEEFEDSQGNVVNKKIYEDLKRQGLL